MSDAPTGAGVADDPCRALREQLDLETAESTRLAEAARVAGDELRQARHERSQLELALRTELALGDRQALWAAKAEAQRLYRERFRAAQDPGSVQAAAFHWLHEIERLNRDARLVAPTASAARGRLSELEASIEQLELRADAARVAAEAAVTRRADWRLRVEACQGVAARWAAGATLQGAAVSPAGVAAAEPPARLGPGSLIVALVRGQAAPAGLTLRISEETGMGATEAHRLIAQLAAELRAAALRAGAIVTPGGHPFWSQFGPADVRDVAVALQSLGHGFDGGRGWDGEPADTRQLAMAVAHAGHDPRSLRHMPNRAELATLWQGTGVDAAGFLAARAADLSLPALESVLGTRAGFLAGLADHWPTLRPLLLADAGPVA